MLSKLKNVWNNIRQLSGDDAYERYLAHYSEHLSALQAANDGSETMEPALSREEFFKQWQDGKWKGIKRCC
jgi:uncharacterized short protein YbdD (DUF466 family)